MKTNKTAQTQLPSAGIPKSPMDLWKLMGGKAKPVKTEGLPPQDSLLAVYKDRLTYTFILGREVASIHFDRAKGELFFKGHNIKNLQLTQSQIDALESLKSILSEEERGKEFLADYQATLASVLAENLKGKGVR